MIGIIFAIIIGLYLVIPFSIILITEFNEMRN